jgi:LmbE family N-acetylglucosaminyl deacetylase
MKIIAIGAHPDDIELGCGGSLALHAQKGDDVTIVVMTGGEQGGAVASTRTQEAQESGKILGAKEVIFLGYPDTGLAVVPIDELIQKIEVVVSKVNPDRVYIPYWKEIHQDHRATSWAALSAVRNVSQILMYEGPSTFPEFEVDFWIHIEDTIDTKLKAVEAHVSQGTKEIVKLDAIKSLNHFRGYQARTTYAEGFNIFRFIER